MACFSYTEGWYNPVRLHSGLGYRSPITYEADMQAAMTRRRRRLPADKPSTETGQPHKCLQARGSFMERHRLGNSDLTVSAIGLGCVGGLWSGGRRGVNRHHSPVARSRGQFSRHIVYSAGSEPCSHPRRRAHRRFLSWYVMLVSRWRRQALPLPFLTTSAYRDTHLKGKLRRPGVWTASGKNQLRLVAG
jgi:hypothetical protein